MDGHKGIANTFDVWTENKSKDRLYNWWRR